MTVSVAPSKFTQTLQVAETWGDIAYSTATAASRVAAAGSTGGQLVPVFISPPVSQVANGVLFSAVVPGVFAVRGLCSSAEELYLAPTAVLKGKAAIGILDNGVNIAWSAVDTATALQAVGAVAKSAIAWTATAGFILLPLTGVLLGYEAYKMNAFRKFRNEFDTHVERIDVDSIQKEQKIERAFRYLQTKNSAEMQKALDIPKEVNVAGMVAKLYEGIKKPETKEASLKKSEKLINNLSGRVSIKWWTSLFSLTMKVIGVVAAVLFLLTPVGQAALVCGALAAIIGLSIQLYSYFAMRAKNKELLALQKA